VSTAPLTRGEGSNCTASPVDAFDVVVVGCGVAGLSVALGLARTRRVLVLAKGGPGDGSTSWAQGGIAAVVRSGDSPAEHARDTLTAGAGAGDPAAVAVLVQEGPAGLADLLSAGARFDTDADGRLSVTREGGHHTDRVVHAGGDATGAEVSRALLAAVALAGVEVRTGTRVLDVLTTGVRGRPTVTGVLTVGPAGTSGIVAAPAVVLATGGLGHAYASSTNPAGVTGDGLAIALRAGASLTDLEFVQFHPTALWTGPDGSGRLPLVSEAVRGAGAVLVDGAGRRVMAGVHPLADLAPRDIVARAITERLLGAPGGINDHVFLDATRLGFETVHTRFPTMVAACAAVGIDPVTQPVPVTPAEHFLCGGIATDVWGRTGVEGLSAVGEVAATGVHGANRLASNSLLEGLVFGRRVAARLLLDPPVRHDPVATPATAHRRAGGGRVVGGGDGDGPGLDADKIRAVLSRHVGIRRDGAALATAADLLAAAIPTDDGPTAYRPTAYRPTVYGPSADGPDADLHTVASALVLAATEREESRGCHWRTDLPDPAAAWQDRQVVVRIADGTEGGGAGALTATVEPRGQREPAR